MKKVSLGKLLVSTIFRFLGSLVIVHTIIRVVRKFYPFPIPAFLTPLIDHPLRRKLIEPNKTALRHGIRTGMQVLEVGPGSGTYTAAAAKRVGKSGHLTAIDIEPDIIEKLKTRLYAEGIQNVTAQVADIYDLPFEEESFDLIYMTAVLGEIPERESAFKELYRVLKPDGMLVFSELLTDPDYLLPVQIIKLAENQGLHFYQQLGDAFYYTIKFTKVPNKKDRVDQVDAAVPHEEIAIAYENMSRLYDRMSAGMEKRIIHKAVDSIDFEPDASVLEIGFGTGNGLLKIAEKLNYDGEITGIDISPSMNQITRSKVNKDWIKPSIYLSCGNAIPLPYTGKQFDLVFLSFTLELFSPGDISLLLKEIRRVMKPGARLVIVNMGIRNYQTLLYKFYLFLHKRFPESVNCRPINSVNMLKEEGFVIEEFIPEFILSLPVDIVIAS